MSAIKIFGWGLLIVGVIIISWTLYSSYNIFTGKAVLPEFFEMPPEFFEMPTEKQISTQKGTTQDIQAQLQQMLSEQLRSILPLDTLLKLLNLAAWSMLAFILIFGGSQISGLGIKLIKT